MTDRELLELAAKAAGCDGLGQWDDKWNCLTDHEGWTFDPLNDDGDALRLAVKLSMCIAIEPQYGLVYATAPGWRVGMEPEEKIGNDPYAATRRAIVRAAAEIGKEMK